MRNVSLRLLLAVIALAFLSPFAFASWVDLGGTGVDVSVLENTPQRIALEFRVGGFERSDVVIDGASYARITLPGEALLLEKGLPELPSVARSVIIPDDRRMELRVVESEHVDLAGLAPIPSKGNLLRNVDPAAVPWEFADFYRTGGQYPAELAFQREPYIMRDFRGTAVVASPFVYDAGSRTLRVYTRLVVELVDAGPGGANVLQRDKAVSRHSAEFEEIYQHHFINWGGQKYNMVPETGWMLVICYDDFAAQMAPFVRWKNEMGLPTEMVLKSAIGTTSTQIKDYIQSRYSGSSSPRLAYVLLVGDAAQIPTPSASGGSSDPSYSKLAGGDNYPDIFVGRFSAENASHVQTQVSKVVNYEKLPLLAGNSWYPRGVGIGSNQGPGDDGEYDYQHLNNIRTDLLDYGYTLVDQIYDPNANAAMVAAAVNAGRTIINYTGHGSTTSWSSSGFSNTHVNQLTNHNMLPFIVSVACVNGQFNGTTCFAEAWLRATNGGQNTGAIATYMASINQGWNPPMEGQDEANLLLVADQVRTFGGYTYNGSCSMMDEYGSSGVTEFNCWHIFGDPSVRLRTKNATELACTHADQIDPDAESFVIDTDCPGALAGLSYQGQYLGSAFADANGDVVIPVLGALPENENILLTVTGYNRQPHIMDIPVMPSLLPVIFYDPAEFDVSIGPDSTYATTLTIANVGVEGSILAYHLSFGAMIPSHYLTMSPSEGEIPANEEAVIDLTFSSAGMRAGSYPGTLTIRYNPQQAAFIPVLLNVGGQSAVDDRSAPLRLSLGGARPNPFAGSTTLEFGLPSAQPVQLTIYDASGRSVRTLASGAHAAGYHVVGWDARDDAGHTVPAGAYFARLVAGGRTLTHRMLHVR